MQCTIISGSHMKFTNEDKLLTEMSAKGYSFFDDAFHNQCNGTGQNANSYRHYTFTRAFGFLDLYRRPMIDSIYL